MIVVDTSGIVAILREEPEAFGFIEAMASANGCLISTMTYFESFLVMVGRKGEEAASGLHELLERSSVEIVPFDRGLADEARQAFLRFGKGRHPAGLNMGDCAAYALAKSRGLPLLYKGRAFARTDVASALP